MSEVLAINRESKDFPRYLAVGNAIFFLKPDVTNFNRDPEKLWNTGYAEICSICDSKNNQERMVVPLKDINTMVIKSNSFPGTNGNFEIKLQDVVCLFQDIDESEENNG